MVVLFASVRHNGQSLSAIAETHRVTAGAFHPPERWGPLERLVAVRD